MSNFRRRLMMSIKKSKLPSGYIELEYLESTGTQYIDTEVSPTANTRIQTEVILNGGIGSLYPIYGSRSSNYTNNFIGFCKKDYTFLLSSGGKFYIDTNVNVDLRNTIHFIDVKVREVKVDSVTSTNSANLDYTSQALPIYIFALNDVGNVNRYSKAKMYSFKIYEGDNLVRNFIPCLDNNGVPCMYDTVSRKTFYNQGTGEFLYAVAK